ncbi:MAG: LLM class flavin-dependent oxidoreductase, partial [Acidobacteria bacterium]|nr:LLM class flavin-dependent oxidoreductase [Acidobacteriota bacterium]
ATLDVVSGGRFVLGMGAGWLRSDYETAGLPMDEPGVRVSRLEESIAVIKGLFGDEPFSFAGDHYRIEELDGLPKPVTRPHPPFFIGGGRPRVLRIAGREAEIVGIGASLRAGELGAHAVVDLVPERIDDKLGWIAEGAAQSGRAIGDLELELNHWLVRVTDTSAEADQFLVGQIVEKLAADRERFGISAVQLDAGYHPKDLDQLAPIVEALAGT